MTTLKAGDRVHWTHVDGNGRTISMSCREGVIESDDGSQAIVKKASGRRETVALTRLRSINAQSQITEFVEAIVEANRGT